MLSVYCTDIWTVIWVSFLKVSVTCMMPFTKLWYLKIMQFHWIGLCSSNNLNSSSWCAARGSHSSVAEESSPVGCDAVNTKIQLLMMWKSLQLPSSELFKKNGSHWKWRQQVVLLTVYFLMFQRIIMTPSSGSFNTIKTIVPDPEDGGTKILCTVRN